MRDDTGTGLSTDQTIPEETHGICGTCLPAAKREAEKAARERAQNGRTK